MFEPKLPQDEPRPAALKRRAGLTKAQKDYQYDHELLPSLPMIADLPKAEENTAEYDKTMYAILLRTVANTVAVQAEVPPEMKNIESSWKGGSTAMKIIAGDTAGGWPADWPPTLEGYERTWQAWDRPTYSYHFLDDRQFARDRVQGWNPMQLVRVDAPPSNFPVSEAHYAVSFGGRDTLAAAGAEGRLYLVDYALFDGVARGTYPTGLEKIVQPCLGLFAVPPGRWSGRELVPVAIQASQTPGANAPIFTPADGMAWRWAKTALSVADGNMHQAVAHFTNTHAAVQPFAMAAKRQLASNHPLRLLLDPHVEGLIEVNDDAQSSLICEGGGIDVVMAPTIEAVRELVGRVYEDLDFDAATLPGDLAARGVDDPDLLPVYPYRDDGLLIWDALSRWVAEYVAIYYPDDATVQADGELQAFIAEVNADEGGRFRHTGQGGRILTVDYLAGLITHVIWRSGPQHAAVNFPQSFQLSQAQAAPLAAYAEAPTQVEGVTEQQWIRSLPPLSTAYNQLMQGQLLGGLYYTQLGQYGSGRKPWFVDRRVKAPLESFQARLAEIEAEIDRRNETRADYIHLKPSLVPQSTNI